MFAGRPFAYRCSLCAKLFAPRGIELTTAEIENIDRDFVHHVCWPLLEIVSLREITQFDSRSSHC